MINIKTRHITLTSASNLPFCLPTFQSARIKTVYLMGFVIRKYLCFQYMEFQEESINYNSLYTMEWNENKIKKNNVYYKSMFIRLTYKSEARNKFITLLQIIYLIKQNLITYTFYKKYT